MTKTAIVFRGDLFPLPLGGLLLMFYHLQCMRKTPHCKSQLIITGEKEFPVLSIVKMLNFPIEVKIVKDKSLKFSEDWTVIPKDFLNDNISAATYDYGLYELLGEIRGQGASNLLIRKDIVDEAKRILTLKAAERIKVAVHLKSVAGQDGQSNANLPIWQNFFEKCSGDQFHFFLIGQDHMPSAIKNLPNVTVVQDVTTDVQTHLCLIGEADMFLGMSSGLCQMAIFGSKPYAVFKNPDHHAEDIAKLLNSGTQFRFAGTNQFFLREYESVDRLLNLTNKFCAKN
jgi:hypothetical protein